MPAEQALAGDGSLAVGGGVEHHFDHPFDVTIHRGQRTDVGAQPARDGGAHGIDVEQLALDFAGLDDVLGQHRQAGLVPQGHAHVGQPSHQETLARLTLANG